MQEITIISALLMALFYWWDTTRTNELALNASRRLCQQAGVQLLDSTVVRQRTWLRRVPGRGLQICRLYGFEYSQDNVSRQFGYVVMIAQYVAETHMQMQTVHEQPE